jgi:twinkle protein
MGEQNNESEFVRHIPCTNPVCMSSDANSLYSDGHTFCFSCNTYVGSSGVIESNNQTTKHNPDLVLGDFVPLLKRNITLESCQKWNYQVGKLNNEIVHIANYYDNNKKIVFQKLRFKNKVFKTTGNINNALLYGQQLWKQGGRKVCICEGEIDSISLSQLFNHKYPVVGIPNGVNGAVKALKKQLEWLESFEEIVLFFDQDVHGQEAAKECAELFTVGKCKIATFELKDVNDMIVANRGEEVIKAMWDAKAYRPDGIVFGTDLWDLVKEPVPTSIAQYPFSGLNKKLFGLRKREIVTVCAGTGVGKTLFTKELMYSLIKQNHKIGIISLEESLQRTCHGILGMSLNKLVHIKGVGSIPPEELEKAYKETLGSGKVFLYHNFGSTEQENIFTRIKFFAKGLDCSFVILDHVSILISGLDIVDERKALDVLFTKLRTLTEELGISLICVAHLKRLDGNQDHTDGVQVSLSHIRGSASIAQLSDAVVSLERNSNKNENKTIIRVLKNRFSGDTGIASVANYDITTGRLVEENDQNFIF